MAARAAFFIEKIQDLAESVGVSRVPQISALAAHFGEADLFEFFQVVGKSRGGDAEFLLDFSSDHSGGMGGQKKAENLQTGFGAERGETVG